MTAESVQRAKAKYRAKVNAVHRGHKHARAVALASGEKKYTGQPCQACASTTRYVASGACVACNSNKNAIREATRRMTQAPKLSQHQQARCDREIANGKGEVRYLGLACGTCCGRERYVSSNKCCLCATDNLRRNFKPTGRPAPDEKPQRIMPSVVPWLRDRMELLTARR